MTASDFAKLAKVSVYARIGAVILLGVGLLGSAYYVPGALVLPDVVLLGVAVLTVWLAYVRGRLLWTAVFGIIALSSLPVLPARGGHAQEVHALASCLLVIVSLFALRLRNASNRPDGKGDKPERV